MEDQENNELMQLRSRFQQDVGKLIMSSLLKKGGPSSIAEFQSVVAQLDYVQSKGDYTQRGGGNYTQGGGNYNQAAAFNRDALFDPATLNATIVKSILESRIREV